MNQALHLHQHTAIASAIAGICLPPVHWPASPPVLADHPQSTGYVHHLANPTYEHADNGACSSYNNPDPKSMASYKELLAQKADLESQIANARKEELAGAVKQVQDLIAEYGLTEDDVFSTGKVKRASGATGSKVAAKYRDPETGATWTGRGKAPKWIADKERAQFAI